MKDLFIEFLKDNDAYEAFEANSKYPIEDGLRFNDAHNVWWMAIGSDFSWIESPEGQEYWSDLDDKWRDIYVRESNA